MWRETFCAQFQTLLQILLSLELNCVVKNRIQMGLLIIKIIRVQGIVIMNVLLEIATGINK